MRFLDYIEGKVDFLEIVDLLDLVDTNKLSKDDCEKLSVVNIKEVIALCKYPVSLDLYNHNDYIKDIVLYKAISYSNKEDFFIVDKDSKAIIIDIDSISYKFMYINYEVFKINEIKNLIKDSIGDYKIYDINSLNLEVLNTIKDKTNMLLEINYDDIYKKGEDLIDDKTIDRITNDIKIKYIYDKEIINPEFDYVFSDSSSVFNYYNNKKNYFIILYLRDKAKILELVEEEFYRAVKDDNYRVQSLNKEFYMYEKTKEISCELISHNKEDIYLNQCKAIISAVKLAGKTVTVNGTKYDNFTDNSGLFTEIEIGSYRTGHIKIKDIKTVSFGRKILFDLDKFTAEFNNRRK